MEYMIVHWEWGKYPEKYNRDVLLRPVRIYSEIDEMRNEIRKVEIYEPGAVGLVSDEIEYCEEPKRYIGLADQPIPPISDGSNDKELQAYTISKDEFEAIWNVYINRLQK